MILEQETFEKFWYYPKDLKLKSNKKILVACDDCGKIREVFRFAYSPLCISCAGKQKEFTIKHRNNMRKSRLGKRLSINTKQKLSESHKGIFAGEKNPMYGKRGNKHPRFGKTHTEKTKMEMRQRAKQRFADSKEREKIAKAKRGKKHSKSTREKMSKAHKGMFLREKNPAWRGGTSFLPYCEKFNEEFRERVREFFNRKCYVCGKTERGNNKKLAVHHVNYDKNTCCDDSQPLFVPLCAKHHTMTNHNRNEWEEFFAVSLIYLTNGKCFYTKEEMMNLKFENKERKRK